MKWWEWWEMNEYHFISIIIHTHQNQSSIHFIHSNPQFSHSHSLSLFKYHYSQYSHTLLLHSTSSLSLSMFLLLSSSFQHTLFTQVISTWEFERVCESVETIRTNKCSVLYFITRHITPVYLFNKIQNSRKTLLCLIWWKKGKEKKEIRFWNTTFVMKNSKCFDKQVFFITLPQIHSFPHVYVFEQLLLIFNIFKTKPAMFGYKDVWFCNKLLHKSSLFINHVLTNKVIEMMNDHGEVIEMKREIPSMNGWYLLEFLMIIKQWCLFF